MKRILALISLCGLLLTGCARPSAAAESTASAPPASASQASTSQASTSQASTSQASTPVALPPQVTPENAAGQPNAVGPQIGQQAPPIELTTLKGETVTLESLKGQPVIINFWASWCVPCKTEMPALQAAYEKYQADGLVVLGVNSTFRDTVDAAAAFVDETDAAFPILLDKDDAAYKAYRVQGLPTSFFVAPDGIIQWVQVGQMSPETLEKYIHLMLIKE